MEGAHSSLEMKKGRNNWHVVYLVLATGLVLGQLVTKRELAGDSQTESVYGEDKEGIIHVTLELVEVGALIIDLLAQLGEPITDHG